MKKFYVLVLISVLILVSCGKTTFLMPQYNDMKIHGKTLVIADFNILVGNPKDVNDDLGEGNPKTVYRDFFEFNFKGRMAQLSTFDEVEFNNILNRDEFPERVFDIGSKEKIYMNIPADGEIARTDSLYGDFILFIQDYQVFRNNSGSGVQIMIPIGGSGNFAGGGGSMPDLRQTCNYVLWDNVEHQVVSYGKIDCPTPFAFAMTTDTWNDAVTNIAKVILQESPFENFPEGMLP